MIFNPSGGGSITFLEKKTSNGSVNTMLSTQTLTSYDYILAIWNLGSTGTGTAYLRINADSGANYCVMESFSGGLTPSISTSQTGIRLSGNGLTTATTCVGSALIPTKVTSGAGAARFAFPLDSTNYGDAATFFAGKTTASAADRVTSIQVDLSANNFSNNSQICFYGVKTS